MTTPSAEIKPIPKASLPKALQPWQWILDPIGLLEKAFRGEPGMVQIRITHSTSSRQVLVNDPQALQYLFSRDANRGLSTPGETNRIFGVVMGENSLIVIDGDRHRRHRQLLTPPFHGDRLKAYGNLIISLSDEVFHNLPPGQPFSTREVMLNISMGVMLQAVFGLHEGERYQRLETLLKQFLELLTTPRGALLLYFKLLRTDLGAWSPGGRIRLLKEEIHALLFEELSERRREIQMQSSAPNVQRTDILSMLMSATDAEGQGLSDQELYDELMTLLVAGHETTATALTWALYWIHSLPDVRKKLLAELDSVSDETNPEQIAKLPFLSAVCQETLRINPVLIVTLPRRVEEPLNLTGYQLVPGQIVLGSIYSLHRRADLYPKPEEFRPERFLEREFQPFEFIPFGAGTRRCIGAALAMYEMKLVLATVLRHWTLERVETDVISVRRTGLTLGPSRPIMMIHRSRQP